MDSAPTMDLGGHELKSRPAEWFRVFIVFLSPSRHMAVLYLKSHQECFLPLLLNFHLIILLFQNYVYSLNFTPAPKPLATTGGWSSPRVGLGIL